MSEKDKETLDKQSEERARGGKRQSGGDEPRPQSGQQGGRQGEGEERGEGEGVIIEGPK